MKTKDPKEVRQTRNALAAYDQIIEILKPFPRRKAKRIFKAALALLGLI